MDYMLMPFRRYADFSGRSRRKEYWMFFLLNMIVAVVLNLLLGGAMVGGGEDSAGLFSGIGGILLLVYLLATIIPSIAVTVRRFHDQDKSGWLVLLGLIPIVGGIILLVFMFLEGTSGPNKYGPDPKAGDGTPATV